MRIPQNFPFILQTAFHLIPSTMQQTQQQQQQQQQQQHQHQQQQLVKM